MKREKLELYTDYLISNNGYATATGLSAMLDGEIIITVSSTLKGTPCKKCGRQLEAFHGYGQEITLRHLPIFERPVLIKMRPRRYKSAPPLSRKCISYGKRPALFNASRSVVIGVPCWKLMNPQSGHS